MFARFRVVAAPIAKGSTRAFVAGGRAVVTSTARHLKGWEYAVRAQASAIVPMTTRDPIGVRIDFILPRPKAHPKTRDVPHTKKPDLDKLARAVLDALAGVVYDDDAQVVALLCTKRHADLGEQPGCIVTIGGGATVAQVVTDAANAGALPPGATMGRGSS